jgi:2-hydroxychromene-2-carboxylate isomerase
MADQAPAFYFDLGSPFSYLTAFRIEEVLPVRAEWRPVWDVPLIGASRRDWRPSFEEGRVRRRDIERRAERYGMPAWRWPLAYEPEDEAAHERWQAPNTLAVMRVATFAQQAGVVREFATGVFHLAFGEGRDITQIDDAIVRVAVDCGLSADDTRAATSRLEIKDALRASTDAAIARGVIGLPTIAVGDELFWGDDRLEEAAAALGSSR